MFLHLMQCVCSVHLSKYAGGQSLPLFQSLLEFGDHPELRNCLPYLASVAGALRPIQILVRQTLTRYWTALYFEVLFARVSSCFSISS